MKRFFKILYLSILVLQLDAQVIDSLNQDVSPKGGLNQLAVKYYGIDFTEEQRELLEDRKIEFIFIIDEQGKATLSEVNGIADSNIIDSLKVRTSMIDNFNPRIRNGIAEPSIYFMRLVFPKYRMTDRHFAIFQGLAYNAAKLEDFEYIHKSNSRFDMIIGGLANQFFGNPSDHLRFGGGMKVDISFTNKRRFFYGMNMSFYGNKLAMDYPLRTSREQNSAPPTLLLGAIFGKWFDKINIQGEINYAIQNVTERLGDKDPDWIQLRGWSPGIVINYTLDIGKEKTMYYYGTPSLFGNRINLHLGFRYVSLSIKQASGPMMELGISYRMVIHGVEEYKLSDEFQNNRLRSITWRDVDHPAN